MEIRLSDKEDSEGIIRENTSSDLSLLIKRKKEKIINKSDNYFKKLNINIKFNINNNHFLDQSERIYHYKYKKYINQELNSRLISMFFNYISSSKVIPFPFKKNYYFISEFLKIIKILLLNEIELVIMTLIFDIIGWVIKDLDRHIFFICLASKHIASYDKVDIKILLKLLNKNNFGFSDNFKSWMNNPDIKEILQKINISNINIRFTELRQPIYLDEKKKKFINYNEIAKAIVTIPSQGRINKKLDVSIFPTIQSNDDYTNIQNNLSNKKIEGISMIPNETFSPNIFTLLKQEQINSIGNQVKQSVSQKKIIEYLQPNYSIGVNSELNPNNSYIPLDSIEEDLFKILAYPNK